MPDNAKRGEGQELPDWFGPVAEDVLAYCRPQQGVWIDLGCGSGGVGLALARMSCSTMLLIDPQAESLIEALHKATALGLEDRVMTVVARAESMPLPDCSVDLLLQRLAGLLHVLAQRQGRVYHMLVQPLGAAVAIRLVHRDHRVWIYPLP